MQYYIENRKYELFSRNNTYTYRLYLYSYSYSSYSGTNKTIN